MIHSVKQREEDVLLEEDVVAEMGPRGFSQVEAEFSNYYWEFSTTSFILLSFFEAQWKV